MEAYRGNMKESCDPDEEVFELIPKCVIEKSAPPAFRNYQDSSAKKGAGKKATDG